MRQMTEQSLGDRGNKINMNDIRVKFGKQMLLPLRQEEEKKGKEI